MQKNNQPKIPKLSMTLLSILTILSLIVTLPLLGCNSKSEPVPFGAPQSVTFYFNDEKVDHNKVYEIKITDTAKLTYELKPDDYGRHSSEFVCDSESISIKQDGSETAYITPVKETEQTDIALSINAIGSTYNYDAIKIKVIGSSPAVLPICEICKKPISENDKDSHKALDCGDNHYACDGKDHSVAYCVLSGHKNCDGRNHTTASCGVANHLNCDGKSHLKRTCGHCATISGNHDAAACGVKGHYNCSGNHNRTTCNDKTHYICDKKSHDVARCGIKGHYLCDSKSHKTAVCGVKGHYDCSGQHKKFKCGHFACDKEYGMLPCGHCACEDALHVKCPTCNGYMCKSMNKHTYSSSGCGHIYCGVKDKMEESHKECKFCHDCLSFGEHGQGVCDTKN